VLAVAVVVHRHRPGPDVHAGSDPGVAQVGVVVDLGPLAHLGVLELREVADPHAGGDATTRAHMAEGADAAAVAELALLHHRVPDLHVAPQHAAGDVGSRPQPAPLA